MFNFSNTFKPLGEIVIPAPSVFNDFDLSKTTVLMPCSCKVQPAINPAIPPPTIPILEE